MSLPYILLLCLDINECEVENGGYIVRSTTILKEAFNVLVENRIYFMMFFQSSTWVYSLLFLFLLIISS